VKGKAGPTLVGPDSGEGTQPSAILVLSTDPFDLVTLASVLGGSNLFLRVVTKHGQDLPAALCRESKFRFAETRKRGNAQKSLRVIEFLFRRCIEPGSMFLKSRS